MMDPSELHKFLSDGKLHMATPPLLYRCSPIWSWREEETNNHILIVTLEGSGTATIDGKAFALRSGVCLLIETGASFEIQQSSAHPLFLFIGRFDTPHSPKSPSPKRSSRTYCALLQNTRLLLSLAEIIAVRSSSKSSEDQLTLDALGMLFRLLIEGATRSSGYFDPFAYEALRAMENDLGRKWTVEELAEEAGVPSRRFARTFVRMMNEPPIQYLIRRRLEEAKRQIQQSSLPIDEIAINLGYNDLRFFREQFKKKVGTSPEDLRSYRLS